MDSKVHFGIHYMEFCQISRLSLLGVPSDRENIEDGYGDGAAVEDDALCCGGQN